MHASWTECVPIDSFHLVLLVFVCLFKIDSMKTGRCNIYGLIQWTRVIIRSPFSFGMELVRVL